MKKKLLMDSYPMQGVENSRIASIINATGFIALFSQIKILIYYPVLSTVLIICLSISLIYSILSGIESHQSIMNSIIYLDLFISSKEKSSNFNTEQLKDNFSTAKNYFQISTLFIILSIIVAAILFIKICNSKNHIPKSIANNVKLEFRMCEQNNPNQEKTEIDTSYSEFKSQKMSGIIDGPIMQAPPESESGQPQQSQETDNNN
ncbi:MAG: hypothetical protein HRT47_12170 [Candidatus Caenarcaniphilales bacterium]|nr:hypothetical protein [Candidatus Caenarcaniphilales bacterium]